MPEVFGKKYNKRNWGSTVRLFEPSDALTLGKTPRTAWREGQKKLWMTEPNRAVRPATNFTYKAEQKQILKDTIRRVRSQGVASLEHLKAEGGTTRMLG